MTSEQKGGEHQERKIVFIGEEKEKRFDYSVFNRMRSRGHGYRGKHRSHTKGKGMFAFLRRIGKNPGG